MALVEPQRADDVLDPVDLHRDLEQLSFDDLDGWKVLRLHHQRDGRASATSEPQSSPSASFAGAHVVLVSIASAAIAARTAAFCSAVIVKVASCFTQASTTFFEKPAESIRVHS